MSAVGRSMDGRARGRLAALLLAIVWACSVVSFSYVALDSGVDSIYIPVMGMISFIFMLIGLLMFMSAFQNINAAMIREFLEVEIPSLAKHMGVSLWASSTVFFIVFATLSTVVSPLMAVAVAFAVFIVLVLSVTVYLSRCGRFEKN